MKLKFVRMGINGEGIGYLNDHTPVFCDGVFPNETALVEITERLPRYCRASLIQILEPCQGRISSPCPNASACRACPLLAMKKEAQKAYKKKLLEEALWKYSRTGYKLVRDMHESPLSQGYRNCLKLPVKEVRGKACTGMYQPGTNHFVTIDGCLMHDPFLEAARRQVMEAVNGCGLKAYDEKKQSGLRYLVLRIMDGKLQCTLITGRDSLSCELIQSIMKIDGMESLFQSINTARHTPDFFGSPSQLLAGNKFLMFTMDGITLQLSPESFFQLNTLQAEKMYQLAVSKIDPCHLLVEAYCGIGTMSLLAHDRAQSVIGIESVPQAVANAEANALRSGFNNVRFRCADAAEGLQQVLAKRQVDALLADPPRSGMDKTMLQTILSSSIQKIIYISCNPATLSKNLAELKKEYDVRTIIPFDMFPNTAHVESISVLVRRGCSDAVRHEKRKKSR